MKPKPELYLFVGDLHVGAPEGLAVRQKITSDRQEWLRDRWEDLTKRIKREAKTASVRLMLGGDLVDLPDIEDGTEHAVDLLRPMANVASEVWGVYGTEYHAGKNSKEDKSVYGQLGARDRRRNWHHWLTLPWGILSWAHHGLKIGKDPWTELNQHKALAERTYWRRLQRRRDPVRWMMRHHLHRMPDGRPVEWRGIQVAVCPCWKFPDSFIGKVDPGGEEPTFGAVIIAGTSMEPIIYEPPDSLL